MYRALREFRTSLAALFQRNQHPVLGTFTEDSVWEYPLHYSPRRRTFCLDVSTHIRSVRRPLRERVLAASSLVQVPLTRHRTGRRVCRQ